MSSSGPVAKGRSAVPNATTMVSWQNLYPSRIRTVRRPLITLSRAGPVAILLILVLAGSGLAGGNPFVESQHDGLEPDTVVIEIDLAENGSAAWTMSHRHRLSDASEESAFEELADEIANNTTPTLDRFRERMEPTVTSAEEATGREMAIANLSVATDRTSLPQEYGIVRYTFRWPGFAAVDDDRILVGDAISGLFLDDRSALHIAWADGWERGSVSPSPTGEEDRRVTWRGPMDFEDDQPRLELTTQSGGFLSDIAAAPVLLAIAALVGLAGLTGVVWWRRTAGPSSSPGTPDAELLSNEEQVLQLLEDEDGRMKQQEVVQRLGWTDAKTSQVISDLREAGDIETFRLGRENVIRLPDDKDPD